MEHLRYSAMADIHNVYKLRKFYFCRITKQQNQFPIITLRGEQKVFENEVFLDEVNSLCTGHLMLLG